MDQRLKFIAAVNDSDLSFAALCRVYEISRKTGYKWVARYEAKGPEGWRTATQASTRARTRLQTRCAIGSATCAESVRTGGQRSCGCGSWSTERAECRRAAPSVTCSRTAGSSCRAGDECARRERGAAGPRLAAQRGLVHRLQRALRAGRQDTLPSVDAHRPCLALLAQVRGARGTDRGSRADHYERAFREFGVPDRMRSDNGTPFASTAPGGLSALSVWWIRLGIFPERIEPGQPHRMVARAHAQDAQGRGRAASHDARAAASLRPFPARLQ